MRLEPGGGAQLHGAGPGPEGQCLRLRGGSARAPLGCLDPLAGLAPPTGSAKPPGASCAQGWLYDTSGLSIVDRGR